MPIACLVALLLVGARPSHAQDTTRTVPPDSISERLRRAEEAIEALRAQLATEAESRVQTASRLHVELFGRVIMNAFSNSARVNNADIPLFAVPALDTSSNGGLGASIRQTSFGIAVIVDRVLGGQFEGELHTDFFGGQQASIGGRHFPLLRVRTAHGTLRWSRGEVLFGQESPLVAGVNPVSVASFGTPEFSAAGNLWLWLPQVRATWVLFAPAGLAVQGAVLAPTSGDPVSAFDTDLDIAERSKRPYLQARVRAKWGSDESAGEIGVGVHRGWLRNADGVLVSSEAVVADAVLPLGRFVEVRGEIYSGQALRGLGGGGIGQNLTTNRDAVEDRGGWAQVELKPSQRLSLGGGCGVGDPKDLDLPAGRLRNRSCEAHVTVHPGAPIIVSLAWRGQSTLYETGTLRNTHVNLGLGFEY